MVVRFILSSILNIWYVEVRIFQNISESSLLRESTIYLFLSRSIDKLENTHVHKNKFKPYNHFSVAHSQAILLLQYFFDCLFHFRSVFDSAFLCGHFFWLNPYLVYWEGCVPRSWHCFPTDRSKVVNLLQFFIVCVFGVSYGAFVSSLFVLHLPFCWCLGRAVVRDCGFSWVSTLIFLLVAIPRWYFCCWSSLILCSIFVWSFCFRHTVFALITTLCASVFFYLKIH